MLPLAAHPLILNAYVDALATELRAIDLPPARAQTVFALLDIMRAPAPSAVRISDGSNVIPFPGLANSATATI